MKRLARAIIRLSIPALVAGMLLAVGPGTALAECDWPTYWPSFSAAVPTANRVLIGTITENLDIDRGSPDATSHFTIHVDEQLRGDFPPAFEVAGIQSEDPRNRCHDNLAFQARVGWQIAIAYGAQVNGIPGRTTTIALIDRKIDGFGYIGLEDLSVHQVRDLAGLPPTDAIVTVTTDASPVSSVLPLGALALIFAWLWARWVRRDVLATRARVSSSNPGRDRSN